MKMNKGYLAMMVAGLLGLNMNAAPAQAEDLSISGDIGAFSQYVWRGVPQTVDLAGQSGKPAVQGDVGASMGGFSGSVWFSNSYQSPHPQFAGRDVVEFDWTLDYSGSIADTGLGYSVGGIYYTYLKDGPSNFGEVYVGLSYDAPVSPSVKVYYTAKGSSNASSSAGLYKTGDIWVDAGLSGSVGGYNLSGTLSYVKWKGDAVSRAIVGGVDTHKSGFSLAAVSVSKDVAVAGVTMTPSLTYTYPLAKKQPDGNRYIYGTAVKSEFVAGLNFSY